MQFLAKTWEVLAWTGQVVRRLFRAAPVPTTVIALCGIIGRLSRVLAFLLPLKVILLAGSPTVPHYFAGIVGPDSRMTAIVVLSAAAVGFYFLTLILEAVSRRLAEKGGDALMESAVGMTVIQNQRAEMVDYYSRITDIISAGLFVFVAFCALLYVEPPVALHLPIFLVFALGVTALALRQRPDHSQTRLMTLIVDNTSNYLGILASIAFLTAFLVILYPLLAGVHGNVLRSIIAVTLVRQTLNSLRMITKDVISLSGERDMIDALTSPEHKLRKLNEVVDGSLQDLFAKPRRQSRFRQEMGSLVGAGEGVDMRWLDPTFRDANRFVVTVNGGEAPARHFEQHVYPARNNRALANEALLFRHIPREELFAPAEVGRYGYGPFECVVYDAGTGAAPPIGAWPEIEKTFLMRLCGLQPAKALADAFKSSHLLLGERLRDETFDKVRIAAENEEELTLLADFRAALPLIKDELNRLPLCLANPEFRPANLNARADGGFFVVNWGQWLIEPFGTRLVAEWSDERLQEFITHAYRQRSDMPADLAPDHVRLVDDCNKLERRLARGNYKIAFASIRETLDRLNAIQASSGRYGLKLSA